MTATAEEISLNLIQIFPAVRVRPLLQDGNVSLRSLNGEVQILQMSPGAGVSRMIEVIQVSILNPHTLLLQNATKRIVVCFDSLQKW